MTRSAYGKLTICSLAFTLAVIVWGAFVRVTGSGAGCGSHWPTCNGEVVPRSSSTATLIEFTHRITSSLALLFVVVVLVYALRLLPKAHPGRAAAAWSLFFMLTEAAVGAGLVLFEKVAQDTSIARGYWMSAHLANTFLLIASMTATTVFAYLDPRAEGSGTRHKALFYAGGFAFFATGISGAIAALGDTLFPSDTFLEGARLDLAPSAHLFLKLRAIHPFTAVASALLLLFIAGQVMRNGNRAAASAGKALGLLVLLQVLIGLVNLLLAAPAALQLLHLLVGDAAWISFVVMVVAAAWGPAPAAQSSLSKASPAHG